MSDTPPWLQNITDTIKSTANKRAEGAVVNMLGALNPALSERDIEQYAKSLVTSTTDLNTVKSFLPHELSYRHTLMENTNPIRLENNTLYPENIAQALQQMVLLVWLENLGKGVMQAAGFSATDNGVNYSAPDLEKAKNAGTEAAKKALEHAIVQSGLAQKFDPNDLLTSDVMQGVSAIGNLLEFKKFDNVPQTQAARICALRINARRETTMPDYSAKTEEIANIRTSLQSPNNPLPEGVIRLKDTITAELSPIAMQAAAATFIDTLSKAQTTSVTEKKQAAQLSYEKQTLLGQEKISDPAINAAAAWVGEFLTPPYLPEKSTENIRVYAELRTLIDPAIKAKLNTMLAGIVRSKSEDLPPLKQAPNLAEFTADNISDLVDAIKASDRNRAEEPLENADFAALALTNDLRERIITALTQAAFPVFLEFLGISPEDIGATLEGTPATPAPSKPLALLRQIFGAENVVHNDEKNHYVITCANSAAASALHRLLESSMLEHHKRLAFVVGTHRNQVALNDSVFNNKHEDIITPLTALLKNGEQLSKTRAGIDLPVAQPAPGR